MGKKKKETVKKAVVKLDTSHMTPAVRVKFARSAQSTAKTSPVYQGSQDAQKAMAAWQTIADSLDQNEQSLGNAAALVTTLRAQQAQLVFQYDLAASGYATVAEGLAKGDRSIISALGLTARGDAVHVAEIVAPIGLKIATSRLGVQSLVWDKVPGARLYVMQISVDPATDTSWVTIEGGGRRRKLLNLAHGQKYLLRVKALGASAEGPWSAVLGITAK